MQQKVKANKLYELDFETKVRIKYNKEGNIARLHVIIEELEGSSGSSTGIYTSSTKILSEGSEQMSTKDIEQEEEVRERRPSTLVRNLEKDNPGIIKEGWINLFLKDETINPRKNTYFKASKTGRTYTANRSSSLNRSLENIVEEGNNLDKRLHGLNVESIDLNLREMESELLEPFVLKVFRRLEFYHSDNINKEYFDNFLSDVHNGYQVHNNPFHNFTHGVNGTFITT
jgi:hypothetical protein